MYAVPSPYKEIDKSFPRLSDTDAKFGVRVDIDVLGYASDKDNLKTKCFRFGEFYSCDVNEHDLYENILDCRLLL